MNNIKHNLNFRLLKKNEINELIDLENSQDVHILSFSSIVEDFKKSKTSKYYVATYNEKIIGYINISIVCDVCDIYSIVVGKTYEQKGVGTYLIEKVIAICQKKDVKKILLEVRKSNTNAISFYKTNGFKKIYERKNYYTNPSEDAYILEYTLK